METLDMLLETPAPYTPWWRWSATAADHDSSHRTTTASANDYRPRMARRYTAHCLRQRRR